MNILAAEYVLPISTEPIRNGAVAFDGTRIEFVGSFTEARDATRIWN
jgi:hypothetical protein